MVKQWHTLIAALMFAGISCSTSSPDSELSWYAKYTVPVINKSFYISDILKEVMLDSNFFIIDPDTGNESEGDTFTLHIIKSDLKTYKSKLFNVNDLNFNYKFNNFLISNMPILTDTIAFVLNEKNIVDGSISIADKIESEFFKTIDFDSIENILNIEISNLSDSIELSEIEINFEDIGSLNSNLDMINSVSNNSFIKKIDVSNLKIDSIINYNLDFKIPEDAYVGQEVKLAISFDINGLSLSKGEVFDQFLTFSFEQLIYVPITTDGFNLSYIDMEKIDLSFLIKNPFPVSFKGNVVFNSMSELSAESVYSDNTFNIHINENDSGAPFKLSNVDVEFENRRISGFWDSLFQVCYMPVTVAGILESKGEFVELSKDLEVGIAVDDPITKITQIKGNYKKSTFVEGKPDDFDMPLTDLEKILALIRDKVKLTDNQLSVELEFLMSDSSHLSEVNYFCIMMMYADSNIVEDTLSWTMKNIKGGDINTYHFEVNKMVNFFPDSIKYRIDYEFPINSEVRLTDTLFKNEDGKSIVVMNVNFNLELISSLVWEISEGVNIDLGVIKIPVGFNKNSASKLLKEKAFYTEFNILNETNFSGKLFALSSNIADLEMLESLEIDSFIVDFQKLCEDTNFLPIMGDCGVALPLRGKSEMDTIIVGQATMGQILNVDSLALRLALQIFPTKLDALVDTDFISLNASATLEGVQSWDDIE